MYFESLPKKKLMFSLVLILFSVAFMAIISGKKNSKEKTVYVLDALSSRALQQPAEILNREAAANDHHNIFVLRLIKCSHFTRMILFKIINSCNVSLFGSSN